jgi:hypothetical protein
VQSTPDNFSPHSDVVPIPYRTSPAEPTGWRAATWSGASASGQLHESGNDLGWDRRGSFSQEVRLPIFIRVVAILGSPMSAGLPAVACSSALLNYDQATARCKNFFWPLLPGFDGGPVSTSTDFLKLFSTESNLGGSRHLQTLPRNWTLSRRDRSDARLPELKALRRAGL